MSIDLAQKLIASGVVQKDELVRALGAHVGKRAHLLRALVDSGALSHRLLEDELGRLDIPVIRSVVPVLRLCDSVPRGLLRSLLAVPVRLDPRTGTVDVAAANPLDAHVATELGYHLSAPIRIVRAPLAAIEEALSQLETEGSRASAPPPPPPENSRPSRKTPPYLTRPIADQLPSPAIPQIRRHNSDMPIPLVRRTSSPSMPSAPPVDDEAPILLRAVTRPPPTRPGPFTRGAPRGPFPDAGPLLAAIRQSLSRDDVLSLLVNGLAMVAGRVGVLAARKAEYRGVACNAAMCEQMVFRNVTLPVEGPSIVATAVATGMYLGPVPSTTPHAGLLRAVGELSSEVAVAPIRVEGHLALVTLLDELGDTMLATKRVEELGRATGEALARVLHRERQGLSNSPTAPALEAAARLADDHIL